MYKIILFLVFLFLIRCSSSERLVSSVESPPDMHTSQISLDWTGTYQGVLPCADCPGIETTITLFDNNTFILQMKYLGEDPNKVFEQMGRFKWNSKGSAIQLHLDPKTTNHYKVGENYLQQLDIEGNIIQGGLSEHYILEKIL